MMKRILIIAICLLTIAGSASAQTTYPSSGKPKYNNKKKKKNDDPPLQRLIFGGGLSLSLGDYTSISLTPVVGYRITENFSAGIGLGYQYVKIKNYFPVTNASGYNEYWDLKANVISPSVWARYVIWNNIFAHAEYETNFMTFKGPGYDGTPAGNIVEVKEKREVPCLLLGGGYRAPLADRAAVTFSVLYDALQDKYSPYGNQPFIRIQFLAGF